MKILKLLNKKSFSIILIFFFIQLLKVYSNEPTDIWNVEVIKPEIKKKPSFTRDDGIWEVYYRPSNFKKTKQKICGHRRYN